MPVNPNPRLAVYTGVFDPLHFGHIDLIRRGARLFDRLVVGVGINPDKKSLFSVDERVGLARTVFKSEPNIDVRPFTGLAVHFVRELGARVMIRGLRTLSDMEYEFTMSLMNRSLDAQIETVFLLANEGYSHISSTLIRQIAEFQGDLDKFVPAEIKAALLARGGTEQPAE